MSRVEALRPELVEFIPASINYGVLYFSEKYKTATHLCCCGCGNKVITPLKPGGWKLTINRGAVTLHPSIGSWSLPCQSHYFIRDNRVIWSTRISEIEIGEVRRSDQIARERYFDRLPRRESFGQIFIQWVSKLFRD